MPNNAKRVQVIPALHKIFEILGPLPPRNPKRVNALDAIAQACLDCQQVGVRGVWCGVVWCAW